MKRIAVPILLALMLSGCAPAATPTVPVPSPSPSVVPPPSTPAPTATATATASPAPTPTLSPDPMIYHFAPNVSPEQQAHVRQDVQTARYYLINHFGSDIKGPFVINVLNDPGNTRPSGHTDVVDGKEVMFLNEGHSDCPSQPNGWCSAIFEVTHLWQSEQGTIWPGCLYTTETDPVTGFIPEGHSGYVKDMALGLVQEDAFSRAGFINILLHTQDQLNASSDVDTLAFDLLMELTGPSSFTKFCTMVGSGSPHSAAFESAFGMTTDEFFDQFHQHLLHLAVIDEQTLESYQSLNAAGLTPLEKPLVDWLQIGLDPSLDKPNLRIEITDMQGRSFGNLAGINLCFPVPDNADCRLVPNLAGGTFEFRLQQGVFLLRLKKPGTPFDLLSPPPIRYSQFLEVAGDVLHVLQVKIDNNASIRYVNDGVLLDESPGIAYWIYDYPHPNVSVSFIDQSGSPLADYPVLLCTVAPPDPDTVFYCHGGLTDGSGILRDQLNELWYKDRVWRMFFNRPGQALSAPFDFQTDTFQPTASPLTGKIVVPPAVDSQMQTVHFMTP